MRTGQEIAAVPVFVAAAVCWGAALFNFVAWHGPYARYLQLRGESVWASQFRAVGHVGIRGYVRVLRRVPDPNGDAERERQLARSRLVRAFLALVGFACVVGVLFVTVSV